MITKSYDIWAIHLQNFEVLQTESVYFKLFIILSLTANIKGRRCGNTFEQGSERWTTPIWCLFLQKRIFSFIIHVADMAILMSNFDNSDHDQISWELAQR